MTEHASEDRGWTRLGERQRVRLAVTLAEDTSPEDTAEIIAAVASLHEDLAGVPIEDLLIVRRDRWTLWIEGPVPILPPRKPFVP